MKGQWILRYIIKKAMPKSSNKPSYTVLIIMLKVYNRLHTHGHDIEQNIKHGTCDGTYSLLIIYKSALLCMETIWPQLIY
jgi:hypothetical protein